MLEIAEAEAAELLGDRLDLARRHALHVHLRQCCHQRLLAAPVAFEQCRRKLAVAIPGHAESELADAGHQVAGVVARPIALALLRPFAGAGAEELAHLGFQHFLQRFLHQRLHQVPVAGNQLFHRLAQRSTLLHGHGMSLPRGSRSISTINLIP
jgi:hypothetical protein